MKKLLLILSVFLVNYSIAQTIGSKVSMFDPTGKSYTGVITDIQGDKYKVKYDGYDFDAWLTVTQFKISKSALPVPESRINKQTNRNEQINNQTQNQTTYKAGDPVEVLSAGMWVKAKILEVKEGGYMIYHEGAGISGIWIDAKYVRTNRNTYTTKGSSTLISTENTIGERYGTREPRTCGDTKAPLRSAITAELAAKYFMCQAEGERSNNLYLVEDVNVQVGGGIPYSAIMGHRSYHEIDVRHPVYPVRGTYTKYQYSRIYDKNEKPKANVYKVKADGYCYKTTFGDWQCRF